MKLLLLGTSGYHPSERRQTACLLLPEEGIVLDAGTGLFRVRRHLATTSLDVLLTHAHLDHIVGLTYLLSTKWQRSLERIVVHGEAAKLAAIREHLLADVLFPAPLPCEWQALGSEPLAIGTATVRHFAVAHPGGAVGYRLDWPQRSLAYVTDTTAAVDATYMREIAGVDLLVHECNFRDAQAEWAVKTGHSFTSAVAQMAARAGVKRLVLTHFDSLDETDDPIDLAAARRIFAPTLIGEDNMELDF